jgi:starch phosphorylase
VRDVLLTHGNHYMHLADLTSYLEADQRLVTLYADADAWARQAILHVASSGKFSSDRTIAEYAADIWKVKMTSMHALFPLSLWEREPRKGGNP